MVDTKAPAAQAHDGLSLVTSLGLRVPVTAATRSSSGSAACSTNVETYVPNL